ncbi:MAG TPA: fatty acid desaturase, partial [Amaricoccus sp.]|nr:fatty acid desaturase [Amaricoccus sp.]
MAEPMPKRDYGLTGASTRWAIETGLVSAEWYHSDVPRATMKALMQRSDGPAVRDTAVWLGLLVASGAGAIWFWGSWWCLPFFAVYGLMYGSGSDSRWHECAHRTAFRTQWMNDWVYQLTSFMLFRNP